MNETNSQGKRPEKDKGAARGARVRTVLAILLICLVVLVALRFVDRALRLGLFQSALTLQLMAAAEAVLPQPAEEVPIEFMGAPDKRGEVIAVPLTLRYDRAQAISMILELEAMQAECELTIAHLKTLDHLGAEPEQQAADMAKATALWDAAQERLGGFLVLEPERARTVLAALGWPWLGDNMKGLTANDVGPPFPERPAALRNVGRDAWRSLLEEADKPLPWPEFAARLAGRYELSEGQLRALQAYLCRRDLKRAFRSPGAQHRARSSLERHAALAAPQMRTVLAMAGTLELLEAGTLAFPPLIDVLEHRPELGQPLLQECVRRTGVREQASRAAAELGGQNPEQAEITLIALGPFGMDAIKATQHQMSHIVAVAEHVRSTIASRWPDGGAALDVLGDDPALWRRWYRQAREVL